jgi:hypothetical protein
MLVRTRKKGEETSIRLDREELENATDLESFEIKPKTRRAKPSNALKSVFEESLGNIDAESIEVVVLGDQFDVGFDRKALTYPIKSYDELLVDAGDRYRDLYRSLAPDGFRAMEGDRAESEIQGKADMRKRAK